MAEASILGAGGAAFLDQRVMYVGGSLKSAGSLNSGTGELVAKPEMKLRGSASPALKGILDTAAGWLTKANINMGEQQVTFEPEDRDRICFNAKVKLTICLEGGVNSPAALIVALRLSGDEDDPKLVNLAPLHGSEGVVIVNPLEENQTELDLGSGAAPVLTIHAPMLKTVETNAMGDELMDEIGKVQHDLSEVKAGNAPATSNNTTEPAKPVRRKGSKK